MCVEIHRILTGDVLTISSMKIPRTARNRHRSATAAAVAFGLVAAACGSSVDTAGTDETTVQDEATTTTAAAVDSTEMDDSGDMAETPGSNVDTSSAVEAGLWGDNVSIRIEDGSFSYVSDGLPNHELPDQFLVPVEGNNPPFDGDNIEDEFEIADTDGLIVESPLDIDITTTPEYSDEVTLTDLSTIGVMISGAPLFNDYEDMNRQFIAVDDNISLDGVYFIDSCNGHPLASGDSYHYHGVPYCITDVVDVDESHSTMIGVLLDGFPIYGPQGADGVAMSNSDLDECSGHVEATTEFPDGIYHYHLTEDAAPYSIDCFHGVIDYGGTGGPGGGAPAGDAPGGDDAGGVGGAPDFTEAAATLGVSVEQLEAALGQPPFDLDAAAAELGVTAEELEAALPAPPGDAPGGQPPADE